MKQDTSKDKDQQEMKKPSAENTANPVPFTQPPNPTDHTRVASRRDVSGNNGLANTGPVTDYHERKP